MALTSRVRVGLVPYTHRHAKRTHVQVQGPQHGADQGSEAHASHVAKVAGPSQTSPELRRGDSPGRGLWNPGGPAPPPQHLQILTLPGHHPLGVPLGQHPCVPVEAGLLHLRERESNRETPLSTRPPGTEFQSVRTVLGRVWGTDVTTTRSRKLGSSRPAGRVEVHVPPLTCPPRGQPGVSTSSSQ